MKVFHWLSRQAKGNVQLFNSIVKKSRPLYALHTNFTVSQPLTWKFVTKSVHGQMLTNTQRCGSQLRNTVVIWLLFYSIFF